MCQTIVITTAKEADAMLAILEIEKNAARVDNYASERAKRVKWMTCTCCGQTYQGRQWWNQDCGYGLGDCCVKFCGVDPDGGESQCYGVPGIHFLIEQAEERNENKRRDIRVHYDNGNTVDTEIVGTRDDILRYYVQNEFNLGDGTGGDLMATAIRVEFL